MLATITLSFTLVNSIHIKIPNLPHSPVPPLFQLTLWFSTGVDFAIKGIDGNVWRHLIVMNWGEDATGI